MAVIFVAGATFGDVGVPFFVAGAIYLVMLERHLSWQVQYLVMLQCHFSWQAQYLVKFS